MLSLSSSHMLEACIFFPHDFYSPITPIRFPHELHVTTRVERSALLQRIPRIFYPHLRNTLYLLIRRKNFFSRKEKRIGEKMLEKRTFCSCYFRPLVHIFFTPFFCLFSLSFDGFFTSASFRKCILIGSRCARNSAFFFNHRNFDITREITKRQKKS